MYRFIILAFFFLFAFSLEGSTLRKIRTISRNIKIEQKRFNKEYKVTDATIIKDSFLGNVSKIELSYPFLYIVSKSNGENKLEHCFDVRKIDINPLASPYIELGNGNIMYFNPISEGENLFKINLQSINRLADIKKFYIANILSNDKFKSEKIFANNLDSLNVVAQIKKDEEISEIESMIAEYKFKFGIYYGGSHDQRYLEGTSFEKFSLKFLEFLSNKPQMVFYIDLFDFTNIIKQIACHSLYDSRVSKYFEELITLDNQYLNSYLLNRSLEQMRQTVDLFAAWRYGEKKLNKSDFLKALQQENDFLYMHMLRVNFSENGSVQDDVEIPLKNFQFIFSQFRIFILMKAFKKVIPEADDFFKYILDEDVTHEENLSKKDFERYGRYNQCGDVLKRLLVFEDNMQQEGKKEDIELYEDLWNLTTMSLMQAGSSLDISEFDQVKLKGLSIIDIILNLETNFSKLENYSS